jgi:hypothetical protein
LLGAFGLDSFDRRQRRGESANNRARQLLRVRFDRD